MLGRHCIQRSLDVLPAVQRQALALVARIHQVLLSNTYQTLHNRCWLSLPSRSIQCSQSTALPPVPKACHQVRQMLQRLVPSSPIFSGAKHVRCHAWHGGPVVGISRIAPVLLLFLWDRQIWAQGADSMFGSPAFAELRGSCDTSWTIPATISLRCFCFKGINLGELKRCERPHPKMWRSEESRQNIKIQCYFKN